MPLGDLRAELTLIGRMALDELERERQLSRLVMREGERFPDLAEAFHASIVERGDRIATAWLTSRSAELGFEFEDVEATAKVAVNALVGYALQQHMFGDRATRIDRERVVAAWTRLMIDHIDPDGRNTNS